MKTFYIVTNQSKDSELKYTNSIITYLNEHGAHGIYDEAACRVEGTKYCYTNAGLVPDGVDCIIVLGGDGTLIQAARDLNEKNIPLLGVNIGTLGYLTDTDMNTVYDTLDSLIKDNYEVDTRMMLDGKIYRGDSVIYEDVALNDVVLSRRGILRVIDFDIYVNGEYLNSFAADGVIAHTLTQRSIIFGQDDEIVIQMNDNKKLSDERVATYDGESYCQVVTGDRVVITRSDKMAKLIKTSKISFLERIRNKM